MNNGMLLKINELRIENDQFVTKSCLINPHKIVSIQSGLLTKTGPQLIGSEHQRELQMIVLEGNNRVFTESTVDEIYDSL